MSLLPISNALLGDSDLLAPAQPGIDGSSAPVLAVPAVAMGAGGSVTGPASPIINGNTAAVLAVPVVALGGGSISGPSVSPGKGNGFGLPGWFSDDFMAFRILVLEPLRKRRKG